MWLKERLFRYEINDLMKEETGTSILFILNGPLALLTPIRLNHPLGLSLPRNYPGASPRLRAASDLYFASEFGFDAELRSHRIIQV